MRLFRTAVGLAFLFLFSIAEVQAQTPIGQWKVIDDEGGDAVGVVEIYEEDGKLYGKVVEILVETDEAPQNANGQVICQACDDERRNQPIEGMVIMEGLERDGNRWEGGRILNPESGREYRVFMEMDGEKLRVRGYVGISAFGRTQVWHPADG